MEVQHVISLIELKTPTLQLALMVAAYQQQLLLDQRFKPELAGY
jgi:hypothetical protein